MANRRHDVICHTTLGTLLVPTRRDGIGVGCTTHTHTHTHTHTLLWFLQWWGFISLCMERESLHSRWLGFYITSYFCRLALPTTCRHPGEDLKSCTRPLCRDRYVKVQTGLASCSGFLKALCLPAFFRYLSVSFFLHPTKGKSRGQESVKGLG
jgi:hypothetical protein